MDTKKQILAEALRQFNEKEIAHVSTTSIANALSITVSDLHFHYKNIDAIINKLSLDMFRVLSTYLNDVPNSDSDLESFAHLIRTHFTSMHQYRFLFLHTTTIMLQVPVIKMRFRQLSKMRLTQFDQMIQLLIDNGILKDSLSRLSYNTLSNTLVRLSDVILIDAEIHFEGKEHQKVDYYTQQLLQLLSPYYTPKGYRFFDSLSEKQQLAMVIA